MQDGKSARGRFHGRTSGAAAECAHPGCREPGEFRAPGYRAPGFDGPGTYRFLCLDHVREFNARYNFFDGMTRDEIEDAQAPYGGWATETRAFASADRPPRWSDFLDPLDAISARFKAAAPRTRTDGKMLSGDDRRAFTVLSLDEDADRKTLRTRYTELVRKFHPDHNGGDRAHEKALQAVIAAYDHLRRSPIFTDR